jgi:hypothetical protein
MYFLTYVSKAQKNISVAEIQKILDTARTKNSENDITGLLLGRAGTFFQLLEGDKDKVLATFKNIAKDPRHENIKVIFEIEIANASKIFPSWKMGFIGGSLQSQEQEALVDSLQKLATSEKPEKEKLLALLKLFSNTLPASARDILAQTPIPKTAS